MGKGVARGTSGSPAPPRKSEKYSMAIVLPNPSERKYSIKFKLKINDFLQKFSKVILSFGGIAIRTPNFESLLRFSKNNL